jgi:basic membrane protein A
VVGPIETGDAKLYVDGFKAGVTATKPDATVNVNWIGSFSDVALASEAAQTHINAGADAMTGTAQMVVGAIGVAQEQGVWWFGTQSNQASLAPEIVVASQVYKWEVVLRQIIEYTWAARLPDRPANGGEVIEFNPDSQIADDNAASMLLSRHFHGSPPSSCINLTSTFPNQEGDYRQPLTTRPPVSTL